MSCLLCSSSDLDIIEKIPCECLRRAYKRKGINVDRLMHVDCKDIKFVQCNNCGLRFFVPEVTGDEAFYKQLQKFSWYYLNDKQEYVYAIKNIDHGSSVLEVGSGSGAFANYLKDNKYTGLEFSKDAVKLAQDNGVNVINQAVELFAEEHVGCYDFVCSFQVLEHVRNPYSFLAAQIRALKKGGKLVVAVPSEDSYMKYITNGIINMPPHHITRWSDTTLRYLPELYDVKYVDVYHEKLAEIHKKSMVSTLIQKCFLKPRLIDFSFKRKVISKFSSLLATQVVKSMPFEMNPNGHTVVAIYEKN